MTNRYTLLGPPGTGKTTTISNWLARGVAQGVDPEAMLACSLTRTAAAVLRGALPIPDRNCATLHSLAYHALGTPPVAEKGALAREWNAQPQLPESWQVQERSADGDAPAERAGGQLALYSRWRSGLRQSPLLGELCREFAARWEDFKRQTGSVDFTDMVELALVDRVPIPRQAAVFCVDEAQDMAPLLWQLADHWGAQAGHYLVAGDGAQTLFSFLGAEPGELMGAVDPERGRVLSQSYRLPQAVQTLAERWLSYHSPPMMVDRVYRPTEDAGMVEWRPWGPDDGEAIVEDVASWQGIGTAMVLTSCQYQLAGVLRALRAAGLPFHNPYRPGEAAWNPLGVTTRGVSASTRFRAFLAIGAGGWASSASPAPLDGAPEAACERCGAVDWWFRSDGFWACSQCDGGPPAVGVWDQAQVRIWTELFKDAAFVGGGKGRAELAGKVRVTLPEAAALLAPAVMEAAATGRLEGLEGVLYARFTKALPYLAAVCKRVGRAGLFDAPGIVVGTTHSVKGGEADHCYVLPHLSPAGERERLDDSPDAGIRQRYVALSRARESLTLCVGRPRAWGSMPVEDEFLAMEGERDE